MKQIIFVALGIGVVVLLASMVFSQEMIIENVTPPVVEKEVTPEWATDQEAVEAAQAVIRRKEVKARLEVLNQEIDEREVEKNELELELGVY